MIGLLNHNKAETIKPVTGTTNRHQWHKKAMRLVKRLEQLITTEKSWDGNSELTGLFTTEVKNEAAKELYEAIGQKCDWTITRENVDTITAELETAVVLAEKQMPQQEAPDMEKREKNLQEWSRLHEEGKQKLARIEEKGREIHAAAIWGPAPIPARDSIITDHARGSKNLKKQLQHAFPGVKFSVTSDSFSMGDSIDVRWTNGPSVKEVDAIADLYQHSDFCGMQDLSERRDSDHSRAHHYAFGCAKYVHCHRTEDDTQPEAPAMPVRTPSVRDHRSPSMTTQIEKHTHTKKGFDFFILPTKSLDLDSDKFNELRDDLKTISGWYSRAWGRTPGGFAHKDENQLTAWIEKHFGGNDDGPEGEQVYKSEMQVAPPSGMRAKEAEKLRTMAQKVAEQADSKLADRLANTPKRQYEAARARHQGWHLQRVQKALELLADGLEAGTLPDILRTGKMTKTAITAALDKETDQGTGYYVYAEKENYIRDDAWSQAIQGLIAEDPKKARERRELEKAKAAVNSCKIPGYFPTPPEIADQVVDELFNHDTFEKSEVSIMEPSCGDGALLDALDRHLGGVDRSTIDITAIEVNSNLVTLARAKGHIVADADFMNLPRLPEFDKQYDYILMNPPFEKGQDVEHVTKAARLHLKEGGRLVAIMSAGTEFRTDKLYEDFRAMIDELGGTIEKLPEGSFKESGTGVNTVLVTVDK